MLEKSADIVSLAVCILGGAAVLVSYITVFGNEPTGFANSRFWGGISASTAYSIVPFQILAAFGFIAFSGYALGILAPAPSTGVLSYLNGYATTLLYATFFAASTIWPFTTLWFLNSPSPSVGHLMGAVSPLIVAAVTAMLFTAGAFEADMHPIAVVGILLYSNVVVMADGVGWNAKFIWNHAYAAPAAVSNASRFGL